MNALAIFVADPDRWRESPSAGFPQWRRSGRRRDARRAFAVPVRPDRDWAV